MKNLIYFLPIMIILVSCKIEPNKDVNPLTKSVITGKIIDEATNSPVTRGEIYLLRINGKSYDGSNIDQNGFFRFEFTYEQCYDCSSLSLILQPIFKNVGDTIKYDKTYARVNPVSRQYDFNYFSEYGLKKGYNVGDKSEEVTFYYHSMSKLRVNYINNTPNNASDSLTVSVINAAVANSIATSTSLYTASSISAKKVLTIENYVLSNKTCTITSRIRKNGQLTVKSQEVVLEPFSTKEVNIEYQ
jgi:hypothetical protein